MSDMTNKENEMIKSAVEETEVKEIEESEVVENEKVEETDNNEKNAKKAFDWKYYFKIGITLLVISAVTATLLAFVNYLTKDKIAENELAVMKEAIGKIFGDCDKIEAVDVKVEEPVVAVYEVYDGNIKKGYGIQVAPTGFKEAIGIIVGADVSGNCVGVEITSISDTPGVGTKVQEKGFLDGFKGLNGKNVSEYDTISGATISSSAVKEGVEAALSLDIFGKDDKKPEESGKTDEPDETLEDKPSEDGPVEEETSGNDPVVQPGEPAADDKELV